MMSALIEIISRLHVLHILHRDVFSVLVLVTPEQTSVQLVWVCHSFLCLLRQQQQIFCQIKYNNDCTMTHYCTRLQQWPDKPTQRQQDVCGTLWKNGTKTPSGLEVTMEIS